MESLQDIEERHDRELAELREKAKAALKGAKKSEKAQVEASYIQMEFDLKAQHREEIDEYEEKHGDGADHVGVSVTTVQHNKKELEEKAKLEESINNKKAKAKKKQEKKLSKEKEKEAEKDALRTEMSGKSMREIELKAISDQLAPDFLRIKDIPSDGNCLYRAISDQLFLLTDNGVKVANHDFKQLRQVAANYIRSHANDFAPFLGLDLDSASDKQAFETYCMKVESDTLAEWGGQLEIRAICEALDVAIHVYAAGAPVLRMGEENAHNVTPLRLAFHRHYFSLGEHYNSVVPIQDGCNCGVKH